jgi:hypothetical protein
MAPPTIGQLPRLTDEEAAFFELDDIAENFGVPRGYNLEPEVKLSPDPIPPRDLAEMGMRELRNQIEISGGSKAEKALMTRLLDRVEKGMIPLADPKAKRSGIDLGEVKSLRDDLAKVQKMLNDLGRKDESAFLEEVAQKARNNNLTEVDLAKAARILAPLALFGTGAAGADLMLDSEAAERGEESPVPELAAGLLMAMGALPFSTKPMKEYLRGVSPAVRRWWKRLRDHGNLEMEARRKDWNASEGVRDSNENVRGALREADRIRASKKELNPETAEALGLTGTKTWGKTFHAGVERGITGWVDVSNTTARILHTAAKKISGSAAGTLDEFKSAFLEGRTYKSELNQYAFIHLAPTFRKMERFGGDMVDQYVTLSTILDAEQHGAITIDKATRAELIRQWQHMKDTGGAKLDQVAEEVRGHYRVYLERLRNAGLLTDVEMDKLRHWKNGDERLYTPLTTMEESPFAFVDIMDPQSTKNAGLRTWEGMDLKSVDDYHEFIAKKTPLQEVMMQDAYGMFNRIAKHKTNRLLLDLDEATTPIKQAYDASGKDWRQDESLKYVHELFERVDVPDPAEIAKLRKAGLKTQAKELAAKRKQMLRWIDEQAGDGKIALQVKRGDGRTVTFLVKNPDIAKYVASLQYRESDHALHRLAKKTKNLKRWGVVIRPGFIIANAGRDAMQLAVQRGGPVNMTKEAWQKLLDGDPTEAVLRSALMVGGTAGAMTMLDGYVGEEEDGTILPLLAAGIFAGGIPASLTADLIAGIGADMMIGMAHIAEPNSAIGKKGRELAMSLFGLEGASDPAFLAKKAAVEGVDALKGQHPVLTMYDEMLESGALSMGFFPMKERGAAEMAKALGEDKVRTIVSPMDLPGFTVGKVKDSIFGLGNFYENIGRAVEMAPRFRAYREVVKKGQFGKYSSAKFAAGDATMDYTKVPASVGVRKYGEITAFFRPQLLGWEKLYRILWNESEEGVKSINADAVGMGVAALTFPSVALMLTNYDDPEYQSLPTWEKNLFWHIPREDGGFWRVPKPFELGVLFGSLPERILEHALNNTGGDRVIGGAQGALHWARDFMGQYAGFPMPDLVSVGLAQTTFLDTFRWQSNLNEYDDPTKPYQSAPMVGLSNRLRSRMDKDGYLNDFFSAEVLEGTLRAATGSASNMVLRGLDKAAKATGLDARPEPLRRTDPFFGIHSETPGQFKREKDIRAFMDRARRLEEEYRENLEQGRALQAMTLLNRHQERFAKYAALKPIMSQQQALVQVRAAAQYGRDGWQYVAEDARRKMVADINYQLNGVNREMMRVFGISY